MKITTVRRRSACPISYSLDIFGDKWSLLILRDILFYDRTRYSDFTPHEHIATNILADRLEKLEAAGLIGKQKDPNHMKQFTYSATNKGIELLPVLAELMLWGFKFDSQSLASKKFLLRVENDKSRVLNEMTQAIKNKTFSDYRNREMGIRTDPLKF